MKTLRILLTSALLAALAACDRGGPEAQRLADERAALEREKAQLAADRSAAERAALDDERARLEDERAGFQNDKAKLAARDKGTGDRLLATERAQRLAAERRAADESAARKEAEKNARTAAENAAAQARSEQSVEFFYDALDPFGDWIDVERLGHCWRPEQARDPRWRPYTDGGWVYTDYGWTWRSNEPFGWATYHYGRWTRLPRLGWLWVPGTEWGPAWVSWRRSDDYIGWAPLPPAAWSSTGFTAAVDSYFDIGPGLYNFVPVADFGEQTYVGHVVAPEKNVTIVNQTTNVTNVTYKTVQNNVTTVNHGPDLTIVNKQSRVPVQQLEVERIATSAAAPERTKVEGKTLQILAPFFKDRAPGAKPKRVKEEVKDEEEDRGWREAKDEAPKIREQAARRARQAEEEQRVDGATEESPRRRVRVVAPDTAGQVTQGARPAVVAPPPLPALPAAPTPTESRNPRNAPEAATPASRKLQPTEPSPSNPAADAATPTNDAGGRGKKRLGAKPPESKPAQPAADKAPPQATPPVAPAGTPPAGTPPATPPESSPSTPPQPEPAEPSAPQADADAAETGDTPSRKDKQRRNGKPPASTALEPTENASAEAAESPTAAGEAPTATRSPLRPAKTKERKQPKAAER